MPTKQFLSILTQNNTISPETAVKYEIDALQKSIPIDEYLLTAGVARNAVLSAKAQILNIEGTDIIHVPVSPQALSFVPESIARKHILIPCELTDHDETLKIVMSNPFDVETIEFLAKKTGKRIVPTLGLKDDIEATIEMFYAQGLTPDISEALKDVEPQVKTVNSQDLAASVKEAPIAKIVTTLLEFAVKGRASDIHIEPHELKTRVRYRIDGILQEKLILPKSIHDSLVSRIKIISDLKIDEKRIPQDGRFNFKMGDDEVDLRVSTLPTVHGEKVVMRLLKKTGGIPALTELGLRGPQLKTIEDAISKPYGIILVTGPTGSGKSTTLYSVLSKLNKPAVNIVTLEDPVEYQLKGVNQVQINPQAGLTFATGLRAFLRQDPNIILVGEIRDKETTSLALQAALTGHLVFSTLHTNDAATAIPRLIDLGGEPFLIASVLNAVLAQRIARKLCEHCRAPYSPSPELVDNLKSVLGPLLPESKLSAGLTLYKPVGCDECSGSGYFGRIGMFEALAITPGVNKMIIQHTTARDIHTQALSEGLIAMKQDGYLKAIDGITTIEEVLRVAEA